jgi:hypothetical protein
LLLCLMCIVMYLFLPHSQNKGQSYRQPPALFCSQECFERVSEFSLPWSLRQAYKAF